MRLAYDPWDGNGNSSQALMYGELVISPTQHGSSLTTVSMGMNGTGGAMVNCLTTDCHSSLTGTRFARSMQ